MTLADHGDQQAVNVGDVLLEGLVRGHEVAHGRAGVEDRCVVLAAELGADGRERAARDEVAAHVHGDLAGLDNLALAALGQEHVAGDLEVVADHVLDPVDGDFLLLLPYDVADDAAGELHRNILVRERRMRDERDQRPFQLAEVGGHPRGEELQHIFGNTHALAEGTGTEHRQTRFVVRAVQLDGEPPFRSGGGG